MELLWPKSVVYDGVILLLFCNSQKIIQLY